MYQILPYGRRIPMLERGPPAFQPRFCGVHRWAPAKTICTSQVERNNLTIRTFMRRFTRLSLGFSKKLENLAATVALHIAYYNFCRVHSSLRVTPAMEAGLTDHV